MPDDIPARDQDRERDRFLIGRLVAGESAAWVEFHARFDHRIRAAVSRAGVSEEENDEVFAIVIEGLLTNDFRRLRRWDERASLSTYLYKISRNLAIDYLRGRPRVVLAGEDEALDVPDLRAAVEAETRTIQGRLREALIECLLRMRNGAERELILLHFHLGLSAGDIVRLSDGARTRGAVDVALSRARNSLREVAMRVHPELAEYLEEDRLAW